ncbi:hypothetical protein Tco_0697551 [Tanacetum coccineum]
MRRNQKSKPNKGFELNRLWKKEKPKADLGKERISKAKRAKTSKNQQEMKRQVQERDLRKDIKAGSARQQEKKVNEDPIEVKGSIMTSFQKFKGSFGCFESPRTKDVKVRKLVY